MCSNSEDEMSDFSGKQIFVLGGSRGIGAAIVRRFARDGAAVAFSYAGSTEAATALAEQTGATAIQSDAADRDAVIALIKGRGPIDVLVVNAGTFVPGDALEADPDAVDRMIDINVRAPYYAAVEAARQMPDGGRIIVIGSTNGDRMPFAGGAAYAMTKSAVQGMARGLARDLGPRGITVNIVQPGPTDTDMNPGAGPMSSFMHDFMAIKRHATSDEIAGMVAYLAGPEAGIVTGAMHTIDGGFGA
jgi:cyclic-di-GMP-binding biofilm dispersal mediator protein